LEQARLALQQGDAHAVANYIRDTAVLDRGFLLDLAYILEPGPHGDPNWRLEFVRRRSGNAPDAFNRDWNLYLQGREAEETYQAGKTENKLTRRKVVNAEVARKHGVSVAQVEKAVKWYRRTEVPDSEN
jgi:hypothetical protein